MVKKNAAEEMVNRVLDYGIWILLGVCALLLTAGFFESVLESVSPWIGYGLQSFVSGMLSHLFGAGKLFALALVIRELQGIRRFLSVNKENE